MKLAFYAAKRGNLHSLYVVREIDNTQDRNLVQWWFITFDHISPVRFGCRWQAARTWVEVEAQ